MWCRGYTLQQCWPVMAKGHASQKWVLVCDGINDIPRRSTEWQWYRGHASHKLLTGDGVDDTSSINCWLVMALRTYLPEVLTGEGTEKIPGDDVKECSLVRVLKKYLVTTSRIYLSEMLVGDGVKDIPSRSAGWWCCRGHTFQKCWLLMVS